MFEDRDTHEEENGETQVITGGAIESIERAQIDQQIATAKKFPRPVKIESIRQQIALQACADENSARECYYVLPRAGGTLDGPSVRLSEIVAGAYRNLHIAGRIIDVDLGTRNITAQAVAWDLENNVRRTAEWSEPITLKSSDAQKLTRLSAIAKAERNAIFKTVPKTIWAPIVRQCIQIVAGDVKSLATRRSALVKTFAGWGIVLEQILGVFGYESLEQITAEDFARLEGIYTAIKSGEATLDDIFKPVGRKTVERVDETTHGKGDTARPGHAGGKMGSPPTGDDLPLSESPEALLPALRKALSSIYLEGTVPDQTEQGPRRGRGRPRKTEPPSAQPEHVETLVNDEPTNEKAQISPDPAESVSERNPEVGQTVVGPSPFATPESSAMQSPSVPLIRAELERGKLSEQRLLSVLHSWKLTDNPSMKLEDIPEQTLDMIYKRWESVKPHL